MDFALPFFFRNFLFMHCFRFFIRSGFISAVFDESVAEKNGTKKMRHTHTRKYGDSQQIDTIRNKRPKRNVTYACLLGKTSEMKRKKEKC